MTHLKYIGLFLLLAVPVYGITQQKQLFTGVGIDYRQDPIDIEDVPRGPSLQSTYGYLTHNDFWKVLSIHGRAGIKIKQTWIFSLVSYVRYGRSHYLEDPYTPSGPTITSFNPHTTSRSKARFDVFIDAEKKLRIRKRREKYLTIMVGLGFTNINSGVSLSYRSNISGNIISYKGSYLHFGPRFSLGYQYKKIKGSLDAYVIEDPLKTNLTSVWTGATISYEFVWKKRRK